MRVAIVGSNQHQNAYTGLVGLTEESVMQRVSTAARVECQRQGHQATAFWVHGSGVESTDELKKCMALVTAWKPDVIVSLHSDAGSGGPRDILVLVGDVDDQSWGKSVGKNLAERVGFAYQAVWSKPGLIFFSYSKGYRRLLLEVGQHDNATDALYNSIYADFLGVMAARAVLEVDGKLTNDGSVTCKVPSGQERWLKVVVVKENPSDSGYFNGYPDGSFHWDTPLTRGQADHVLAKVRATLADIDETLLGITPVLINLNRGMAAIVERIEALETPGKPEPATGITLDTPLAGVWVGTGPKLGATLGDTVLGRSLADYYVAWAKTYGLRADILWAQMCLETNNLNFGGQVTPDMNNWCGLKTRDGSGFASFGDPETGVVAHVEHMAWYVNSVCVGGCGLNDPRHLGAHGSNGWVRTVRDLSGRWSTGTEYAGNIVKRASSLGL